MYNDIIFSPENQAKCLLKWYNYTKLFWKNSHFDLAFCSFMCYIADVIADSKPTCGRQSCSALFIGGTVL